MRKPDLEGPAGQAWELDIEAISTKMGAKAPALVAVWVVHAPNSHPVWPWVRVILGHLRAIDDVGDPLVYVEGATHEFIIDALNPHHYPPPVDDWPGNYMTPSNFAAQFIVASDEEAIKKIRNEAIKPIVHGFLNPDSDGIGLWIQAFGDSMIRKEYKTLKE